MMKAVAARLAVAACAALLVAPGTVFAQTYLIDTGPGTTGAWALFGTGATNCSPVPECQEHFNYLAARITLPQAATISGIDLWVVPFSFGGAMDVKIREEVATPDCRASSAAPGGYRSPTTARSSRPAPTGSPSSLSAVRTSTTRFQAARRIRFRSMRTSRTATAGTSN